MEVERDMDNNNAHQGLRSYVQILGDGDDRLTIPELLKVLEFKLSAELADKGCKIPQPLSNITPREIDMRSCPEGIRPQLREFWALLRVIGRIHKKPR